MLGLNRNTLDKFYTKTDISKLCVDFAKTYIQFDENDTIIEPSAGNGSFIEPIKSLKTKFEFYDLYPEHSEIKQADYLELNFTNEENKIYHVIGNPPFGRQSSSAIKFLKKSCEFASSISLILPKSFRKESMQKHIHKNYHLMTEMDIPNNSFLVNGIEHDVPCVFQVWVYKDEPRIISDKLESVGYSFVKKSESPDISFRRVGVNAGLVDFDTNKSEQSHYFIRFDNRDSISESFSIFSKTKFESNNTVGPKSISKQEIIRAIKLNQ